MNEAYVITLRFYVLCNLPSLSILQKRNDNGNEKYAEGPKNLRIWLKPANISTISENSTRFKLEILDSFMSEPDPAWVSLATHSC